MTKAEQKQVNHVVIRLGTLAAILGAFESCVKHNNVPKDEPLDFETSSRMKIVYECIAELEKLI